MTELDARNLFISDLEERVAYVKRTVSVSLNQEQFEALVIYVFNIVYGNFESSPAYFLIESSEYRSVPDAIRGSFIYSGGFEHVGLIARREREASQFAAGNEIMEPTPADNENPGLSQLDGNSATLVFTWQQLINTTSRVAPKYGTTWQAWLIAQHIGDSLDGGMNTRFTGKPVSD